MADWRVRVMAIAVTAGWAAVACGSRTGDYLGPGYDDGAGFGPGGVSGADGFGGTTGDGFGGNTQTTTTGVTDGFGVTASGVGATFGMGFSASGTTRPSSFVSGAGGFVGFTTVSGSAFGSSNTVSTGVTGGGIGGATGSCCEESSGPGCEDPDVTACVCSADPFCCKYLWDSFCVQEVEELGCGRCDAAVGGAGGAMQSAVTTGMSSSGGGSVQSAVTTGTSSSAGGAPQSAVTGMQSAVSVVTGIGGASSSSTTGEGGAGGVAECIAQSQTDCEACLCGDCFQAYGDCVGDFGCPRILECMDSTGCTGLDCYAPGTCQRVIDRFGGLTGASVGYVTGLVECAVGANCPCQ